MTAAEVFRQAEELKAAAQDTSRGANEVWMSRQALQDVYQKLLVMDLEYALDKKVEQELWNHAFKNQISSLQNQVKDKQNQKRGEIQASLNLFLETASGFYLQLLQELCSTFNLDLPFRKKASYFGIIKEYGPGSLKIKLPKKTSCMYICQHCLVHLGDIARYRQQIDQAQAYYRHAARLVPYNDHSIKHLMNAPMIIISNEILCTLHYFIMSGQPYNQLAILEAAKGNKLSTVFYYVRSIAVKHPFPVASTNLEKLYVKISKDSHDYRQKLTAADVISLFLQLHSFIFLGIYQVKTAAHIEKILMNLPPNISSMSFSSYQLIQMVALNLYALHHFKCKMVGSRSSGEKGDENGRNRSSESSVDFCVESSEPATASSGHQDTYSVMLNFTASLFDVLIQSVHKARESPALPATKVVLDWLRSNPEMLSHAAFSSPILSLAALILGHNCNNKPCFTTCDRIWVNLCKMLNGLQLDVDLSIDLQPYAKSPLPEDCDLECFHPVHKALSQLDFSLSSRSDLLSEEIETALRCQRLVNAGYWIAEDFPSLNRLNAQQLPTGRLDFSTQLQVSSVANGENSSGGKFSRQNVAIQAILQKTGGQQNSSSSESKSVDSRAHSVSNKLTKREVEVTASSPVKHDAGIMTTSDAAVNEPENYISSLKHTPPSANANQQYGASNAAAIYPRPVSADGAFVRLPMFAPRNVIGSPFNPAVSRFPQQAVSHPDSNVQVPPPAPNTVLSHNYEVHDQQVAGNFDRFPGMYRSPLPPRPNTSMLGPNFFPAGQPMAFPPSRMPMFVPRSEMFSNQGQNRSAPMSISAQPWHGADANQIPMGPYGVSPMAGNLLSHFDSTAKGVILGQTGSSSPVSPDLEAMESGSQQVDARADSSSDFRQFAYSPVRFPSEMSSSPYSGGTSRCADGMPVGSPFSYSPSLESAQLSRSLPATVKLGGVPFQPQSDDSASTPGTLGSVARDTEKMFSIGRYGAGGAADMGLSYNNVSANCTKSAVSSNNSLFTSSADGKHRESHLQSANTYSLFGQSPWPISITNTQMSESNSHRSSPFSSSANSSLRNTPDPFSAADDRSMADYTVAAAGSSGGGGPLGYGMFPTTRPAIGSSTSTGLGVTTSGSTQMMSGTDLSSRIGGRGMWMTGNGAATVAADGVGSVGGSDGDIGVMTNMQSLWSSGPSPLQKLLEQQKQQRQVTPR